MTSRFVRHTIAAALLMLNAMGCYATVQPDYVVATSVPPNIVAYPSYVYGGHPVYLANNRWYYQRGNNWVYYRQEPPDLYRYRMQPGVRERSYVQHAPPAYGPNRQYSAPPRYTSPAPGVRSAPPATQVR